MNKFHSIKRGLLNLILGCLFFCGNASAQSTTTIRTSSAAEKHVSEAPIRTSSAVEKHMSEAPIHTLSQTEGRTLSGAEGYSMENRSLFSYPSAPLRVRAAVPPFRSSSSNSPYSLNTKKEVYWLSSGISVFGLGYGLGTTTKPLTADEILNLNPNNINSFDRFATENYDLGIQRLSDGFLYSSFACAIPFLFDKKVRKDVVKLGIIYTEAATITAGTTLLTKYLSERNRPFVYNSNADLDEKLRRQARHSFFSGHTSIATMNTFFIAKVFSDYHPESKYKPYFWAGAILIPAATGYARVEGGKHFPTDVIAGYAVGALAGYFVPHFHEKKNQKDLGFHIYPSPFGVLVNVDLN